VDRAPVLEGERLLLRPLAAGDWDALWAIASDRELWAVHPAHDRWQEPVFRAFFDQALVRGGALVVIDSASGRIIGSSQFQDFDPADGGSVEIGWTFLARAQWGSGANAEMKRLMLTHAFRFVERALFVVGENNVISRRAMQKIGGRLTGETRDMPRGGEMQRHVVYAIDRESFAAGPLSS
jgi:RimJ/RimL family protein N-acetyltransferase